MIFLMFSLTVLKLIYFLVGKLRTRYYQESREGLYSGPTFLLSYFISSIPVSAITSFLASLILFRYLEEILKTFLGLQKKDTKLFKRRLLLQNVLTLGTYTIVPFYKPKIGLIHSEIVRRF